jgi:hypothetical protein
MLEVVVASGTRSRVTQRGCPGAQRFMAARARQPRGQWNGRTKTHDVSGPLSFAAVVHLRLSIVHGFPYSLGPPAWNLGSWWFDESGLGQSRHLTFATPPVESAPADVVTTSQLHLA